MLDELRDMEMAQLVAAVRHLAEQIAPQDRRTTSDDGTSEAPGGD